MALYKSSPCTQGLYTVADCLGKLNWFDIAYQANGTGAVSCPPALQGTAGEFRDNIKRALILCADENPMSMFGIMEMMVGSTSGEETPAKTISRKEQCRYNYWFQVAQDVTGAAGDSVTVVLAPQSHFVNGTASLPNEDQTVDLPGNGFTRARISAVDRTVPFGHTIVLVPSQDTQVISLKAGDTILPTQGRLVGATSCPADGQQARNPGKIHTVGMQKIRADYCLDKDLLKGFWQGVLQFPMGFIDGKVVECFDFEQAILMRRAIKMTKDRLYLTGEIATNTEFNVAVDGFAGFDGLIPSILYGGGQDYQYSSLAGFNPDYDLGNIVRYANANKRAKEYNIFMSLDFSIDFDRKVYNWIGANPGTCTFQAFNRMNKGDIEYLGIQSVMLHGYTFHKIIVQEWSDPTMYGAPGFPYRNMAIIQPISNIKDSDGKTVPPIEFFYPKGCGLSGSYHEEYRDMEKIDGCEQIKGHATEEFTMMPHCLEDWYLLRDAASC